MGFNFFALKVLEMLGKCPASKSFGDKNLKHAEFKRKTICAVIVAATYFPQFVSSIIGAIAFNFRVRNETGWIHDAKPPL